MFALKRDTDSPTRARPPCVPPLPPLRVLPAAVRATVVDAGHFLDETQCYRYHGFEAAWISGQRRFLGATVLVFSAGRAGPKENILHPWNLDTQDVWQLYITDDQSQKTKASLSLPPDTVIQTTGTLAVDAYPTAAQTPAPGAAFGQPWIVHRLTGENMLSNAGARNWNPMAYGYILQYGGTNAFLAAVGSRPTVPQLRWMGCFKDTGDRAVSQDHAKIDHDDLVMGCARKAREKNMRYIGLQAKTECRMTNSLADAKKHGESTECDTNTENDRDLNTGGAWANAVYSVEGVGGEAVLSWPGCAQGNNCVAGNKQIPNRVYNLPDNRCLRARTECVGCMTGSAPWMANQEGHFASCRRDVDTRQRGYSDSRSGLVIPFDTTVFKDTTALVTTEFGQLRYLGCVKVPTTTHATTEMGTETLDKRVERAMRLAKVDDIQYVKDQWKNHTRVRFGISNGSKVHLTMSLADEALLPLQTGCDQNKDGRNRPLGKDGIMAVYQIDLAETYTRTPGLFDIRPVHSDYGPIEYMGCVTESGTNTLNADAMPLVTVPSDKGNARIEYVMAFAKSVLMYGPRMSEIKNWTEIRFGLRNQSSGYSNLPNDDRLLTQHGLVRNCSCTKDSHGRHLGQANIVAVYRIRAQDTMDKVPRPMATAQSINVKRPNGTILFLGYVKDAVPDPGIDLEKFKDKYDDRYDGRLEAAVSLAKRQDNYWSFNIWNNHGRLRFGIRNNTDILARVTLNDAVLVHREPANFTRNEKDNHGRPISKNSTWLAVYEYSDPAFYEKVSIDRHNLTPTPTFFGEIHYVGCYNWDDAMQHSSVQVYDLSKFESQNRLEVAMALSKLASVRGKTHNAADHWKVVGAIRFGIKDRRYLYWDMTFDDKILFRRGRQGDGNGDNCTCSNDGTTHRVANQNGRHIGRSGVVSVYQLSRQGTYDATPDSVLRLNQKEVPTNYDGIMYLGCVGNKSSDSIAVGPPVDLGTIPKERRIDMALRIARYYDTHNNNQAFAKNGLIRFGITEGQKVFPAISLDDLVACRHGIHSADRDKRDSEQTYDETFLRDRNILRALGGSNLVAVYEIPDKAYRTIPTSIFEEQWIRTGYGSIKYLGCMRRDASHGVACTRYHSIDRLEFAMRYAKTTVPQNWTNMGSLRFGICADRVIVDIPLGLQQDFELLKQGWGNANDCGERDSNQRWRGAGDNVAVYHIDLTPTYDAIKPYDANRDWPRFMVNTDYGPIMYVGTIRDTAGRELTAHRDAMKAAANGKRIEKAMEIIKRQDADNFNRTKSNWDSLWLRNGILRFGIHSGERVFLEVPDTNDLSDRTIDPYGADNTLDECTLESTAMARGGKRSIGNGSHMAIYEFKAQDVYDRIPGQSLYDIKPGGQVRHEDGRCLVPVGTTEQADVTDVWNNWNKSTKLPLFKSCRDDVDTRWTPSPQTVQWPECRVDMPKAKHGSRCDAPNGQHFKGWTYRLPNNRCLIAKDACQDCLMYVAANEDINSYPYHSFDSCGPGETRAFVARDLNYPTCRNLNVAENDRCVTTTYGILAKHRLHFPDGRCVKLLDPQPDSPLQVLEDRAVESLYEGGAKSRFLNPKHNVFTSCDPNYVSYMGKDGYVDWPACEETNKVRCITPRGVQLRDNQDGVADNRQVPGTKYRFPDGRCFQARKDDWCKDCLPDVWSAGSNSALYDRFDSCETGRDTRYQRHLMVGPFNPSDPNERKFTPDGGPWWKEIPHLRNDPLLGGDGDRVDGHGGICDKECHMGSGGKENVYEIIAMDNTTGVLHMRYMGPHQNDQTTNNAAVGWPHNLRIAGKPRRCLKPAVPGCTLATSWNDPGGESMAEKERQSSRLLASVAGFFFVCVSPSNKKNPRKYNMLGSHAD